MRPKTSRTRREPPKHGTVTRVSPQQATAERMNIYLDDRYAFSMSVRALSEHPVSVGDHLGEADIARLRDADERTVLLPPRSTCSRTAAARSGSCASGCA